MGLDLNLMRPPYKVFPQKGECSIVEQMPILIAEERVPMSISQIMQRRLDLRNSRKSVRSAWINNYFGSGDGIAYGPKGKVKVVLDSEMLRNMTPETPLDGTNCIREGLSLTEEEYENLNGQEFMFDTIKKQREHLSRREAKEHPIWRILARDQHLLNEYADYIFTEGKQQFGYDVAMATSFTHRSKGPGGMKPWRIHGLGNESRSEVDGFSPITWPVCKVIGLDPNMLHLEGKI